MIEYDLERGEPQTAAALLDELAEAPAELRAQIDGALAVRIGADGQVWTLTPHLGLLGITAAAPVVGLDVASFLRILPFVQVRGSCRTSP